ncbi:TRAP transporter large permease [Aeromicrobium sp. 50.2.37]|uniref:TRAP transporter large permease n=1 Tax=Aeromicrobium sp. 50.2.37 TaxID=2969305 RepID=UPI0021505233|nr:TRAP transporter large permease [Aeromicrobium sp. 50.2.37]MCR4514122.1 TRAP transporter large permease [Aeromicrobium sp. 50.2.37]
MIVAVPLVLVVVLLLVGVAVAAAFGLGSIVGLEMLGQDLAAAPAIMFAGVDSFPLMAVPFFLLAGTLMKDGGISTRLVRFIGSIIGRVRGSAGLTVIYASAFFGAISGSSVATVSAMGSILSPEMRRDGYPSHYIGALTAVSGTLGILIPPSIPMIVFGIATGTSIGDLFLAGISAGVLLIIALTIIHLVLTRRFPDVLTQATMTTEERDSRRLRRTFGPAVPALTLPFLILGGIYGGVFTPTEAGAVACLAAILLGFLVYRTLTVPSLSKTMREAAITTASLLIILAAGTLFSRFLTLSRASTEMAEWVAEHASNPLVFLLLANIVIAAVALFVEENTTIIILAPLLVPIAVALGIDPVHFGAIMVVNMGISLSTPPMAPNLFIAAKACDASFTQMTKPTLIFLGFGALPVLVLVTLFPDMVLFFR